MANKIERHYGLGLLSGKVLAYQRVISLIKTELSKTSAEHQDAILHLKALLSDVYSFHADAVIEEKDKECQVMSEDARDDAIEAARNGHQPK